MSEAGHSVACATHHAFADMLTTGLGFGSMAPGLGERLGPLIVDAVRRSGARAVVQAIATDDGAGRVLRRVEAIA